MKKIFLTAFLAALGLALPAMAQVSASPGDLVLGFRATGGTGQNVNLEVNLGTVAQFQGLASGATLVLSRLAAADLTATYGSGWATRTDLYWGVVGTAGRLAAGPNGSPIATLWATNAEGTVGTQSAAWTPGSRGAQFNASSSVEALLLGAPGSLNGASATNNSSMSSVVNGTVPGSYAYQDGPLNPLSLQFTTSFGFFNPTINNSVKADTSGYAVSDLYESRPGDTASIYLGSFGLKADGTLTFSTSPTFFTGSSGAPTITTQPVAQAVAVGGNATFTVAATGSGTLGYQWYKDGTAISGATSSSYSVTGATSANAGNYSVKVTNSSGSITSTGFALTVGAVPNRGRFINLSVLTAIAAGDNFTFGFVVGGAGTSGNKPLLMRAAGPALTQFGYTSAQVVADPYMEFYHGTSKVTQDDDWAGDSSILATAAAVGAFPYPSTTSKDSAIYVSAVGSGDNSVKISGIGASAGTMIAELYDATPSAQFGSTTPRLINVSVLKNVGASTTVGFVVGGSTSMNVLVRAVGPTLGTSFSYPNVIADPKLTLYSGQTALGSNDDWGTPVGTGAATGAQLSTTFTAVGAFNLTAGSKDAAILTTLAPGDYTVQVTAASGSTGNAIIELYEVP